MQYTQITATCITKHSVRIIWINDTIGANPSGFQEAQHLPIVFMWSQQVDAKLMCHMLYFSAEFWEFISGIIAFSTWL